MVFVEQRQGAALGYERSFGQVSHDIIPALMRFARLTPGQCVLDIATGTGIAAAAAAAAVGPLGSVVAGDLSPPMLEGARQRLGSFNNVTLVAEDAHALTQSDVSFDTVLCHLGLMSFHNPSKALSEFRRVLKPDGRVVMSVNPPDHDYTTPVTAALAACSNIGTDLPKWIPSSTGDQAWLREMLAAANFRNIVVVEESYRFKLPTFDAYFLGIERGDGDVGRVFAALTYEERQAVRQDVIRRLSNDGGPFAVDVIVLLVSGRR